VSDKSAASAEELLEAQNEADAEFAMALAAEEERGGDGHPTAPAKPLTPAELQAKVEAMRLAKVARAKEDERAKELKRRAEGAKGNEGIEELRKAQAKREEEKRKAEERERERAMVKTKLEIAKDQGERESRDKGAITEATRAKIAYLQDLFDGKSPPPPPMDIPAELKKRVMGLTVQKAEGIGGKAADVILALLGNVLKSPGEEKFRRVPYTPGKPVHAKLSPASAGWPLMALLGWVKEGPSDDGSVFLTLSSGALAANEGHIREACALIEAAKASNEFAQR